MKTSDFEYDLPPEFIAQRPIEPRDASRLLILRRENGAIEHAVFHDIGKYLIPGDLLVLNKTRVIPARLFARKPTGGRVEILLLRREDMLTWECLLGGKGLSIGKTIFIEKGPAAEIVDLLAGSRRRIRFKEPIEPYFSKAGNVPLPPYIHETLKDPNRYQTVYASKSGSVAAPTAGLHFTKRLIKGLQAQAIKFAYITLHVGLDTFSPVPKEDPSKHSIHTEWCELPQVAADAINQTRQSGGRIIAVGTTSVRTLESAARQSSLNSNVSTKYDQPSILLPYIGNTDLFIIPGFKFNIVDCLITNFHLPRSTLIMLVSAFAGRETILNIYELAKQELYRFYSFGDAMLIL